MKDKFCLWFAVGVNVFGVIFNVTGLLTHEIHTLPVGLACIVMNTIVATALTCYTVTRN